MVLLSKPIARGIYRMKRILSVLLVLLFVAQIYSGTVLAANESGSPKHIPRIVSVVFDDSGSMYKDTDRWAYASYAMQAFVAMMGEEDVLYVTYLNASTGSIDIVLSNSAKQGNIEKIEKAMFGGGTPNKLAVAAKCLEDEYKDRGANAKYYLVAMCDGELDPGQGELSSELEGISAKTATALSDADFETVYFAMYNDENEDKIVFDNIPGVDGYSAKTGNEIVNVLRNISADIMGRTKIEHSVSGGKLSFDLKYPALSVAVFVQKQNTKFANVRVPITKNGSGVSYNTGVYYVDCPTEIVKNPNVSIKYQEKVPVNPPSGFVALIDNGNGSVAKGSYTIDFSSLGINSGDLVVLVEPAVKIGCKYYLGDDPTARSFEEIKKFVREGDEVLIECGLYEMNSDGSLGDPVPLEVLSPDYKVYINDSEIGKRIGTNKFEVEITKEHENKELKIEAVLKGYQPFVLREYFGELNTRPEIDFGNGGNSIELTITKPELQDWINGNKQISFPLVSASSTMLSDLSIRVEGINGLQSGVCSSLANVSVSGNNVVYTPKLPQDTVYSQLGNFKVVLVDNTTNTDLAFANITVIQPDYKFEISNRFEGIALNLGMLKNNDKSISFKLTACYDNSGNYAPISNFDCEKEINISLNAGKLTGEINNQNGEIIFTPRYDSAVNADVPPSDIVGSDHTVYASATVDGKAVESEKVIVSVAGGSYKIEVENGVTELLNLDSLKTNTQKVIFKVLADYNGDGNYGAVEDWDSGVFDKLNIESGKLLGIVESERDENGKIIGKSFTPRYDENAETGIVFTEVAGRTHTVTATVSGTDTKAQADIEVKAPNYDIIVQNDGFTIVDTDLRGNEIGVEFLIKRDGRVLNKREVEGLAPYNLSINSDSKKLVLNPCVREAADGTAYLCCVPVYEGLLPFFFGPHGDLEIKLTLGEKSAVGELDVIRNRIWIIGCFVLLGVLLLLLYIVICWMTLIRIEPGTFYVAEFIRNGISLKYTSHDTTRAYKLMTFKGLPRQKYSTVVCLGEVSITVTPTSNSMGASLFEKNYPVCDGKELCENNVKTTLNVNQVVIPQILAENDKYNYEFAPMNPDPTNRDVSISSASGLYYEDGNRLYIAFYLTKEEEEQYTSDED